MKRGEAGFTSSWRSAQQGFACSRRSAQQGFTLIELLIALTIFAMLSAAGVLLLGNAVSAQGAVKQHLDAQGDLLRVVALIESDMAQAVPRISRTESGTLAPAFFARTPSNEEPFVQFVRGGWANMDNAPRPALQKVEYWLREGRLERRTYPMVDGAEGSEPALLVEEVSSLQLSFRGPDGAWIEEWQQPRPLAMPVALRMVVTRAGAPSLTLIFRVGTGEAGPEAGDGGDA